MAEKKKGGPGGLVIGIIAFIAFISAALPIIVTKFI